MFEEPFITPTNVGTWKLLLEGSVIQTDKKHSDKQSIERLPIYITTATPIDNNVQQAEKDQIAQRLKIFNFSRTIQHRPDTVTRSMLNRFYIKPPVYITALHFAALFLVNYPHVYAFILDQDQSQPALNVTRIPLQDPECRHQRNVRMLLRTALHHPLPNLGEPEMTNPQLALENRNSSEQMGTDPI